jgi:hypothetical protein
MNDTDTLVKIIEDTDDMPEGSVFYLEDVEGDYYLGLWASMGGTYEVKVEKKYCEIIK